MTAPADARPVTGGITALVPDPRRAEAVKVEVDGRLLWTIGREAAEHEGLVVGLVPGPEVVERLEAAADEEAALRTGLRALARRPFARRDLGRRLERKGHPSPAVERALAHLAAMELLDDLAFAGQYVESKSRRGQGPRRLLADLRRLGVEQDTALEAIARTFPPGEDLTPQIEALARKRAGQLGDVPPTAKRRRVLAYLARRGFGGHDAVEATDRALAALGDG